MSWKEFLLSPAVEILWVKNKESTKIEDKQLLQIE